MILLLNEFLFYFQDEMNPIDIEDGVEIFTYALKNNCSRETYHLLFKTFPDTVEILSFCLMRKIFVHIFQHDEIYDNIHKILQAGYRKLAASIIGDIKDNTFHGFNSVHHQVCFN